jgi:hypothetical protein
VAPVQDPFAHDVVESDGHKAEVDEHLPKAEEAVAGDVRKLAVDDGPGHHEDHFHIEEDEENGDQIEAHAEAALRIANGLNAALVGVELDLGSWPSLNELDSVTPESPKEKAAPAR